MGNLLYRIATLLHAIKEKAIPRIVVTLLYQKDIKAQTFFVLVKHQNAAKKFHEVNVL